MIENKLAVRDELLFPLTFEGLMKQAEIIAQSGVGPKGMNAAGIVAVTLAGREFGLGTMESLRSLYPVNGRVTMYADLMIALAMRRKHWIDVRESTSKVCEIDFYRADRPADKPYYTHKVTWDDAVTAQLAGKDTYKKHPRNMLMAMCKREGARIAYPDVLSNVYTPDELGAEVNEDNEVIDSGANVFDAQATKEILLKQLTGWYPNKSALAAVWKEYLANHALTIAWKDITIPQLQDFLKWADPAIQSGKVVDAEWDDTSVTPTETPEANQADTEAEARKERNKDKTRTRSKPKANDKEPDLTPAGTDAELFDSDPTGDEDFGR